MAVLAFIAMAVLIAKTWLYGDPVKGYPSLMCVILFLGGIQLTALGMLGEYIGRIFEEVKHRPVYIVTHEDGQGLPPAPDAPEPPNREGTNPAHTIAKCQAQNQTQSQVQNQDQGKMP